MEVANICLKFGKFIIPQFYAKAGMKREREGKLIIKFLCCDNSNTFKRSLKIKSIFHYIYCVPPNRVTSLRTHVRVVAPGANTEILQRWRAVDNLVFDLI